MALSLPFTTVLPAMEPRTAAAVLILTVVKELLAEVPLAGFVSHFGYLVFLP